MAISAFSRLLPFLEEQMRTPLLGIGTAVPNKGAQWLAPTGGTALSGDGSSSLEGILQNAANGAAVRKRRTTDPDPEPPFQPSPARPFPGVPLPREEEPVYANERERYADPLKQYTYEHGIMHGEPEHKGFWNRLKHIGLGALSGGVGITQGGANQDLGSLIGGMLGGGIFGGVKPESADRLWDRFIVEPEGEREYKKKLIQEQIQFDREKRKLDLENVRGAITGRKWSQAMEELQARNQWDAGELTRQNQEFARWVAKKNYEMAQENQQMKREEHQYDINRPYAATPGYIIKADGSTEKAPGFDERFGQGRNRGFSPAAIGSALERMDPIAKIVADTYANDPDAPYRIIAGGPGGQAKADEVRITHEIALGLRDGTNPEPGTGKYYSRDVVQKNEKLLQKAEAAAKAQMETNARGSRGLQIEWLRHPANAWDPYRDEKPSFPTDQQIRDFLQANPYSEAAPGGGGVPSDQMTFPPEGGGVTPVPAGVRDRTTGNRRKPYKGVADKMDRLLGED